MPPLLTDNGIGNGGCIDRLNLVSRDVHNENQRYPLYRFVVVSCRYFVSIPLRT